MSKIWLLAALLFLFSCGGKKSSSSDEKPSETTDFFAMFPKLKLPYDAWDTSLAKTADTTTVSGNVLQQFVPDSVLDSLTTKKGTAIIFHPVGKIENKTELYLLLTAKTGKKTTLFALLFDNGNQKKKSYLNHLTLISDGNNDAYIHSVDINTEPTFTITKDKTVNDQYNYTKTGFAYNSASKNFIEVINESNENTKKNTEIINPIDTLTKLFKYSGDYEKDKTNFISVRDGNVPNKYTFFLHFEKNKGDCTGELKGILTLVDATKAVFQQSGDPCVIDFSFEKNSVKVKERGSCGNHRGITCLFDDSYRKKKEELPHPPKGNKKPR